MSQALFDSHIPHLPLIHRGKVRDIYSVDEQHLLIVTTDRLSAFDVILPTPIAGKGEVLTQTALFWFRHFEHLIPNHLATDLTLEQVIPDAVLRSELAPRTMLVKKLKALPIEAIARGYLIGSGWKDYQATGAVCGIPLPAGLQLADKLPEPIYTPSSKADVGEHDENIDFATTVTLVGLDLATQVRDMTLRIYKEAAAYALARGIIIADTKFEFGVDEHGTLHLIDEALTPDSSRFWPLDSYAPGKSPDSFDKQFVRDWLETLDWDKTAPGPQLPADIVERTASKYREALQRLTA
ncbi:MAG: phosphoribosylaminoimidazolesuccinocarboxamide synthase [Gammaproteobacteria bacterium 28-57-27]|nr:MAG: phosphoribosylaminoimidazolesuccinocarboxamide synthase [Gammaproteobacteria bacterium 28-57-27]